LTGSRAASAPPPAAHLPPGAEYDPTAGAAPNLTAAWRRHWQTDPDRVQIHDVDRGWSTRGELEAISAERAARLARLGLARGDRILLSAASSFDLVASYVASLRLGLVAVPTNTAYGPRELEHVVTDARPRAAIVDEAERGAWLAAIDSDLVRLSPALETFDGGPPAPSPDRPTSAMPPLDAAEPGEAALICYTSGTTGRPKGAVLSHANCLASAAALAVAWRWTEADRLILALPLFHMHGLGVGLHGTLFTGGSAVLQRGFRPEAVLDAIAAHSATLFFGVPTMYHRLAAEPRAGELAPLRLCVSGSAPMPATLHAAIEAASGQRVLERYGMTETLMLVSNPHDGERRPGSVGLPLPGVELRLEGEPAEIQVRGPNVFGGYWERPDANAEAFTPDGWFRTGDLGAFDDDGYVRIVGRAKELIISGGYNVHPREVEDALREDPAIDDVAVVGEPSEEWGERIVAYVVPATPEDAHRLDLASLRARLGGRLAPYKHPRAVHAVEALPRNALGKVQKHRLAQGRVRPE
jgi:malonyl-CoA/methylmalonyl-CoA synthetase